MTKTGTIAFQHAGWRRGRFNIAVKADDLAPRVPMNGWVNATETFGVREGAVKSAALGIVEMARLTHLPSGRSFGDFENIVDAAFAADLADEITADIEDEDLSYILKAWTYWVERGFACFSDEQDLLIFYRPPCSRLLRLAFEHTIAHRPHTLGDVRDRFPSLFVDLNDETVTATLEEAFANVKAARTERAVIEAVAAWNGMTLADYYAKLNEIIASAGGDTRLAQRRARRWLDQLTLRDPSGPPAGPHDGEQEGGR